MFLIKLIARRGAGGKGPTLLLSLLLGTAALPANAAPRLRCELNQGEAMHRLEVAPTQDPYHVQPTDLQGRFRFKAVVVGNDHAVEYVKIYSYDLRDGRAVLLQEAKYLQPTIAPAGAAPDSLTGTQFIYSPRLGREMQYRCALQELAP